MTIRDGSSCPGCGLANYEGMCPVCRGDYPGYVEELQFAFGPWGGDVQEQETTTDSGDGAAVSSGGE